MHFITSILTLSVIITPLIILHEFAHFLTAKLFKVKVKKVNTINTLGKIKSFKNKYGRRSDSKKAIVTLDQESTVDISAGIK